LTCLRARPTGDARRLAARAGRRRRRLGRAGGPPVALESISPETLESWSELCAARIALAPASSGDAGTLTALVRGVDGLELRVESELDAEYGALRRSRALLLAAGALALVGALAASAVLSRGLVAAMRELLGVAEQIGSGDLTARSAIARSDEVGDLARAVNEMAERLQAHGRALLAQHAELRDAKDRAEGASRAKTEFLANVSHEIRTPMTAVLGYTDLLLAGEGAPAERSEWAAAVRRNGAHLLELIDGILDVSRLENELMTTTARACALRELVAEVAEKERATALAKGLDFAVEVGAECPEAIATDPARLRQILGHLLRNAVKFTAAGAVRLRVGRAAGSVSRLVFEVSDSGIGIAPHDCERIFDPFGQADASHTRRFGGVGLGLAVSRRLATLLGGTLDVKSELGSGSSFRLEIRRRPRRCPRRRQSGSVGGRARGAPCARARRGGRTRQPALDPRAPALRLRRARGGRERRAGGGARASGRRRGRALRPDPDGHADAGARRLRGDAAAARAGYSGRSSRSPRMR
jgi:signal transduction histidine kinase